jgi:outer membrane protein OmpA-like peptidoglycan-associated protein
LLSSFLVLCHVFSWFPQIEGHADVSRDPSKKDSPKIMQLTEDRAGAVVRALVSRGSSIELLHPLGLGGMRPLDHTHALKKVRFF